MVYLEHVIQRNEGQVASRTTVENIEKMESGKGYLVETRDDEGEPLVFEAECVVNSGGLWADKVAKLIMKEACPPDYRIHYVKGHYFGYNGPKILNKMKLLYPIPEPGLKGLGIHATVDLKGNMRFGPDTKLIESIDYGFDEEEVPKLHDKFYKAVKSYIPNINPEKMYSDYTGIRPKLSPVEFKDFIIKSEADKGFPNLVNLIGIESPGLTSCLAIAEMVAGHLGYKEREEWN